MYLWLECQHARHLINATKNLNSIIVLYQLSQTINAPTRVTMTSSSLLDFFSVTPNPDTNHG